MTVEPRVTVGIPTYNRSRFLRETIESVLVQTLSDFRLLVCDNASEDDTEDVVRSFADPRIRYARADQNIGMIANFNHVLKLAETEYVVILPDDDLLYPHHLERTVAVLDQHSTVGVVHTAFDLIDDSSRITERGRRLVPVSDVVAVEPGAAFLDRSMRSSWTVCWPTAAFRTRAVVDAGGLRVDDLPLADFPLLLRIATCWDFASDSATLAAARFHARSATASIGTYGEGGYDLSADQPRILHGHRMHFLDAAGLPEQRAAALRAVANTTWRRDRIADLARRAGSGAPWLWATRHFSGLVRDDPRTLLMPTTWKFCVAHVGGRRARRFVRALHLG